ncbi:MAG: 2-C-methyl-D-erythritol 2,4-cyclodiphosphate synthase [Candidatus Aadella gelida]|nr:2-C-methyl-D-erythritol 2,4-cyclodiphosphate synthase [Candidatus Aadella gelida]
MRIGIGYDIHELKEGRTLVLGGVTIPSNTGPLAHSDGDVLLHAISDAILGALGKGDIGMMFPDTDQANKGRSSVEFLGKVSRIMDEEGFCLGNLDCIIITESPKIALYSEQMKHIIGKILACDREQINVKGKTAERLGKIGAGKAIEAHAAVLLQKK